MTDTPSIDSAGAQRLAEALRRIDVLEQEVAEYRRTTQALRDARAHTEFALESARVGIWDADFTARRLQWSPITERMYGVAPGTFDGTFDAFMQCVHPDDRQALDETVARANRSGQDFVIEHRALWPDGSVHWITGAGRVERSATGAPLRAVGLSIDITERRMLETEYRQAQKMDSIGRLAGGIAHDFNNLLTSILGYCELMIDEMSPADSLIGDVLEIQRAGQSAAALTRQLLAFSRKQIIEPALLNLNTIVSDLQTMLRRLIGEHIRVELSLAPNLPRVKADRSQLEQIIFNLAVNAKDAMAGGGLLQIETAAIDIDDEYSSTHLPLPPGSYVVLTVTDTGTGMTPDVQEHLFEPFFTTKERGKGTGLGLATVYGIVRQNAGAINVYSEAGRGTSFKIYLPEVQADRRKSESEAHAAAHGGSETILLVEDDPRLRELTRRMLERQGYTVFGADSAERAEEISSAPAVIDILLTDVVMPGLSGPELAERVARLRPGLKVLFMSGYTEESVVHHGVLREGIAFIHKPFTSVTLTKKLRDVLDVHV